MQPCRLSKDYGLNRFECDVLCADRDALPGLVKSQKELGKVQDRCEMAVLIYLVTLTFHRMTATKLETITG